MTEAERHLADKARLVADRLSAPRTHTYWSLQDVTAVRELLRTLQQLRAYPRERQREGAP